MLATSLLAALLSASSAHAASSTQPVRTLDAAPPALAAQEEDPLLPVPETQWEGAVNIGASLRRGNTEISNLSALADAVRESEWDRWTLGFLWNYDGEDGGGVQQRRVSGNAKYDYFLTERSFALAAAGADHDFKANLDLRYKAGVGYGYQFLNDEEWKLSAEGGLSYVNEEYMNGVEDDFIAARLASSTAWVLSELWTFEHLNEVLPSLEDNDDVIAKFDTRAKATLSESMFGQLQWLMDWDKSPSAGRKETDHVLLLSLGWKF